MTTDVTAAHTLASMDPFSMGVKFARGRCYRGNDGTLYMGERIPPIDWTRIWPAAAELARAQRSGTQGSML
jgi:hypothetical protein